MRCQYKLYHPFPDVLKYCHSVRHVIKSILLLSFAMSLLISYIVCVCVSNSKLNVARYSQMQDALHGHWLEAAQKCLIENSSTRRRYLQNKIWVQEVHSFIKSKKKWNKGN